MRCADCRDLLTAYLDGELMPDEQEAVRDHLASCADCAREHDLLAATSRTLKEGLVLHQAPDVLKARIRSALAQPDAELEVEPRRRPWMGLIAAGVVIAAASSALTFAAVRRGDTPAPLADALVASHIRSLMPGHLTDVTSTNQHNVKPWFNGRLDLSPAVPSLDSAGFPLVGGRLDYVDGRTVAAVVYARRQHLINVYSWPAQGARVETTVSVSSHGYHLVHWRADGLEDWAVSDLNQPELEQFVALFQRGGR